MRRPAYLISTIKSAHAGRGRTGATRATWLISQMPPPPRCDTEAIFSALYSGVMMFAGSEEDGDVLFCEMAQRKEKVAGGCFWGARAAQGLPLTSFNGSRRAGTDLTPHLFLRRVCSFFLPFQSLFHDHSSISECSIYAVRGRAMMERFVGGWHRCVGQSRCSFRRPPPHASF